tara:strand:- start:228 stop:1538 length:1311 start_codon:yes stop_codon:yes gene_type:complete
MQEFSLEKICEDIHYGKSKIYFKEVLSSYYNKNYRSAVVMLWSVAVCDIVFKLQSLIDLYGDKSAKQVLDEVTRIQNDDPRSSKWEVKLIEDTYKKTNLLDTAELANLQYLQTQRHLSAHPVLNKDRELHSPNKETVRSLLRNTLEELLVKPPFYSQHIFLELIADLDESSEILNSREKTKKYVESRYLQRTTKTVELSLFRSIWKLVFRLDNPDCNKNRLLNLYVLENLASRNKAELKNEIEGDQDYYSNISPAGLPLSFLVHFLSEYPDLHPLLNEDAHLKITHCIDNDEIGKTMGWFIKPSLEDHAKDIEKWISGNEPPSFKVGHFEALLKLSDTEEWQSRFCKLVSLYYGKSTSYDQADSRYQESVPNFIKIFDKESLIYLADKIENNAQCHDRNKARHDYVCIKNQIDEKFGEDFEYEKYEWFSRKLDLEK